MTNAATQPQQVVALTAMLTAISTGDRAEAWYQLRYGLNHAGSATAAREHFDEAQVFGLFQNANPHTANDVSGAESLLAFRVATQHQTTIAAYETLYSANLAAAALDVNAIEAGSHLNYGAVTAFDGVLLPALGRLTCDYADLSKLAPDLVADLPANTSLAHPGITAIWVAPDSAGDQGAAHVVDRSGGGTVNDLIFGGITVAGASSGAADTLNGGAGDDIIVGGKGADAIDGGAGEDTVSFLASGKAVGVDLGAGVGTSGDANGDTYAHIENVLGSAFNDTITGNGETNVLYGAAGSDQLVGGAGSDILVGGSGADTIFGDALNRPDGAGNGHLSAVAQADITHGNTLVGGLGGAAGYGENSLAPNDDGSSAAIDITGIFGSTGLGFFGTNYTQLYVNNNGNITFTGPLSTFTPGLISAGQNNPIIAAFWADVDTRNNEGASDLVYYDLDAANGVFTATWYQVGFYSGHANPYNSFQIELLNEGHGNFDIVLRYQTIGWTTGDVSGGAAARAGYSAGNGTNYLELSQSGSDAAMRGLPTADGNTGIDGVFVFHVVNGQVQDANDTIDGGAGADTLTGGAGADTFVFHAGEANGDTVTDFTELSGDMLRFVGYAPDATFTQIDSTHWQVGADIITFSNAPTINSGDYIFG